MALLKADTWKRWMSWFNEIRIDARESDISGKVEAVWVNGRKVLNSERANYSYGTLYRVFQKTFKTIHLENESFQKVLILGYGAGGTAQILRDDYDFKGIIHGVEYDREIVEIAKTHFHDGYAAADEIFISDAQHFVQKCQMAFYDLVIFDVYVDLYIPDQFQEPAFISALDRILNKEGMLFYNKVMSGNPDKKHARVLYETMNSRFSSVEKLTQGLQENLMFVCRK